MNTICRRVRTIATAKRLTAINVVVPAQVLPAQKCLARFSVRLAVKSAAWKRFLAYKAIRNIIAHNHGRKKNDTTGRIAEAFARRHANIEIEGGRITLNRDFCLSVIDDMRVILARTINAIPQKLFEYDPPTKLPRSVRHK